MHSTCPRSQVRLHKMAQFLKKKKKTVPLSDVGVHLAEALTMAIALLASKDEYNVPKKIEN